MLSEECAQWGNVEVTLFRGLLVDFCAANGIDVISKGLRGADFDYELQMAQMNRQLTGVDTVFLPTAPEWAFVSSSLVREVATLGGDVSAFLPANRSAHDGSDASRSPEWPAMCETRPICATLGTCAHSERGRAWLLRG